MENVNIGHVVLFLLAIAFLVLFIIAIFKSKPYREINDKIYKDSIEDSDQMLFM